MVKIRIENKSNFISHVIKDAIIKKEYNIYNFIVRCKNRYALFKRYNSYVYNIETGNIIIASTKSFDSTIIVSQDSFKDNQSKNEQFVTCTKCYNHLVTDVEIADSFKANSCIKCNSKLEISILSSNDIRMMKLKKFM